MAEIAPIGGKKKIRGKWYRKEKAPGDYCTGCHFFPGCPLPNMISDVRKAVEHGGSECDGTIWLRTTAPKKAPAKPKAPNKATWSTKFLHIHPKSTKADLAKLLQESVDQINSLGIQLVRAQNTIATLRKKAAK